MSLFQLLYGCNRGVDTDHVKVVCDFTRSHCLIYIKSGNVVNKSGTKSGKIRTLTSVALHSPLCKYFNCFSLLIIRLHAQMLVLFFN